jgi:hypothetical protein
MALTDFNEYVERLSENRASDFLMNQGMGRSLRLNAIFNTFSPVPATPTASIVTDKNSLQSIGPIPAISTGRLTFLGGRFSFMPISTGGGGAAGIMIDLLNISGGMNATLTTPQTTGLPTAALTRYTSGEGVRAGIVIFTQVGNTLTTVTVSYTNQAGVSGRTSTATSFGSSGTSGSRETNAFIPIPLQAGDTGVRSIESVTLAGTTGTAGNFGVCLYKPLSMISLEDVSGGQAPLDAVNSNCIIGSLCEIHPDACLTFIANGTINTLAIGGAVILTEA